MSTNISTAMIILLLASAVIVIGGAGPAAYGDHKPSHKQTVVYCFEISVVPEPICEATRDQCESQRGLAIARGADVTSKCKKDKTPGIDI